VRARSARVECAAAHASLTRSAPCAAQGAPRRSAGGGAAARENRGAGRGAGRTEGAPRTGGRARGARPPREVRARTRNRSRAATPRGHTCAARAPGVGRFCQLWGGKPAAQRPDRALVTLTLSVRLLSRRAAHAACARAPGAGGRQLRAAGGCAQLALDGHLASAEGALTRHMRGPKLRCGERLGSRGSRATLLVLSERGLAPRGAVTRLVREQLAPPRWARSLLAAVNKPALLLRSEPRPCLR